MPKNFHFFHFLCIFFKFYVSIWKNHSICSDKISCSCCFALHMRKNWRTKQTYMFSSFLWKVKGLHNPIATKCFPNCKNASFQTLRRPIQCSKWGEVALVRVLLCTYESRHIFHWKNNKLTLCVKDRCAVCSDVTDSNLSKNKQQIKYWRHLFQLIAYNVRWTEEVE